MTQLTRRRFLQNGGLAAAALALRPLSAVGAPAAAATRYSAASGPGKEMLAVLADGVTKMRALPESNPRSWVFQWYTHLVKGSNFTPDENKAKELARIFTDPNDPNRALAEAMWNTCEPHVITTNVNYFLPWHRMYVYFFEQVVRELTNKPAFTLPYWDYTDPAQLSIPAEFRRPAHPVWKPLYARHRFKAVNAGKPIDVQPHAVAVTLNAMQFDTYEDVTQDGTTLPGFCSTVMSDPHKQVHFGVGDLFGMKSFPYTANDPLFWLHHCNVDRLWASWNRAGGKNPSGDAFVKKTYTFVDGSGAARPAAVGDFLDTSALGYGYDAYVPRADSSPAVSGGAARTFTPLAASAKGAGRIKLRAPSVTVRLTPEGSAAPGSFAERVRGAEGRGALYLLFEDLSAAADPDVVFDVHLAGRSRTRYARSDATFLGAIEFMEGARAHAGHAGAGAGRNHGFVVGASLRKQLADASVAAPLVTLVPTGSVAARSAPTIGRVVLGSLGPRT